MQVLNKNTKVIGFAAGIAAAAAGIYLLVKKALNETQISMSKALTQDEKSAIVSQIEVNFDGNNLSLETISQIVEASIAFMAADFDQLTWENREARRASTEDLEKYIKYCLDFSEGLKSIIVNSQRDIASGLGIREEVWETSHSYHIQKPDGSLLIMQRRVPSRLRMNMKSHKSLSKDEFYNVLKQHISLLETESNIIEKIQSLVANPYSAIGIFQNIVNDMIAEEFGVEEEDFLNAITLYKDDNEARILLDQFQNAVRGLTSKTTKAAY